MGRGTTKATKKYAASGQLKKSIQARHKHQQIKKKIQGRKGKQKHSKGQSRSLATEEDEETENNVETSKATKGWVVIFAVKILSYISNRTKGMTVDSFLNGGFMDAIDDDSSIEEESTYDSWFD